MRPAAAFAAGVLAGVLVMLAVTGTDGRAPRPATEAASFAPLASRTPVPAIPAGSMGRSEPDPAPASLPAVTPAPRATPAVGRTSPMRAVPTPAPARHNARTPGQDGPSGPTRRGVASYVNSGLGRGYMAARMPKGTRLQVCGPVGCITGTVNDYGPRKRVFPGRIVDLSAWRFTQVCGPLTKGTCRVKVEVVR